MKFGLSYKGFFMALMAAALSGCSLIDEDMTDCGDKDYTLEYELRLVTNMTTELQTQLNMSADVSVSTALKAYLKDIFTDFAHDVDLAFYDVEQDSVRLHHEQHVMDANQSSYTLYIPVRQYMHLAVANLEDNGVAGLDQDEKCHTARLRQPVRDTISSHGTGLFTARLPMDIKEGVDQQFNVSLYMANCASALVLDTLGSHVKDIRVYAAGFATGFNLADSTYVYDYTPIVRADRLDTGDTPGTPMCFAAVTFPSRSVEASKSRIETTDPAVSLVSDKPLWQFRVYAYLPDGTITETLLGVSLPLGPGQFKIIKASIIEDGSCAPKAPYVGASVALDWDPGMAWVVDF